MFASGFSLLESDGIEYHPEDLVSDVNQAATCLNGITHLTIDASNARSTLIGLMLSQNFGLNVALARDVAKEALPSEQKKELVHGVFAWPDCNRASTKSGIWLSTSGTTGKAKTAFHELERLLAAVKVVTPKTDVKWLLTYEPASFAGIQVLLTAAINGSKIHVPERSINSLVSAVFQGITHISATPTFWRSLLSALPSNQDLPLRAVTLGGESCNQDLLDELTRRFPSAALRHIYASTEAGVGFTVSDGLAGFPLSWLQEGVQNIQLRIRDNELEILTQRSMLQYASGEAFTSESGWLRTGDLVEIKNDRVMFQGRRDNVVNIGGAKVLPEKVEAALCSVEGVIDIAVNAQPNPILGFLLVAQVCVAHGTDLKKLEIALKLVAVEKLPSIARPVRYWFVNKLDHSNGKKVRRHDFN
jgi:acyl-coenzyme A synthetase/AMP-(fatty) acid ligase